MYTQNRLNARDAKRVIHSFHILLSAIPTEAAPHVARGFAKQYNIPKKAMVKAMAHYTRILKAAA